MGAGSPQQGVPHYKQELDRGLHVLGNVMITISGVAPTASVFILAPIAMWIAGTGAFLAFVIAGVIGIGMAFSYAEAGTAFPVTGGEWPLVARILGKPLGFISLAFMLVSVIVIPSSIALGAGQYLSVDLGGAEPQPGRGHRHAPGRRPGDAADQDQRDRAGRAAGDRAGRRRRDHRAGVHAREPVR